MKRLLFVLLIPVLLCEGCATLFGGSITECQRTRPKKGEPSRAIRGVAFVADITLGLFLFEIPIIVDFIDRAIYRPCSNVSPQTLTIDVSPDTTKVKQNNEIIVGTTDKQPTQESHTPLSHADSLVAINGRIIHDSIENGLDQYIKMDFSIDYETLERIKNSAAYIADQKKYNTGLGKFLHYKIDMAGFKTKLACKNETSFTILPNTKGSIFYSGSKMTIYIPFQAQNGYGNMIYSKSFTNDEDGCLVSDNN